MAWYNLKCVRNGKLIDAGSVTRLDSEDEQVFMNKTLRDLARRFPNAESYSVEPEPLNEGFPHAIEDLVERIRFARPDLSREELMDHEWLILPESKNKYVRGAYIATLGEAAKIFADPDADYRDWVYFRDMGIVIFDVTKHTSHEIFTAFWYNIIKHILPTKAPFDNELIYKNIGDDSERFLTEQCGFFKTSAYGASRVTKSANLKLTNIEKGIFGRFKFGDIE